MSELMRIGSERVQISEEDLGTGDPRCPLVLLLDVSDSMSWKRTDPLTGQDLPPAIEQLRAGLDTLSATLKSDDVAQRRVEILVVPFQGQETDVQAAGTWKLARDWTPPKLSPSGRTPMGTAIRVGLAEAAARRRELQKQGTPVYRPWVFLMTDGEPTDDYSNATAQIAEAQHGKNAVFWSVAALGADESILKSFDPEKPVLRLDEKNWSKFFLWMSAVVSKVSNSVPGQQTAIDPWTLTA
jgi:uncharacterized protein YegL